MDRKQWFTVEVGSSMLSAPTQYVNKIAYKTQISQKLLYAFGVLTGVIKI